MELKLIDTGYLNINKTGTQLSVSERAGYDGSGGVTTFDIPNILKITTSSKMNTSDDPIINSSDNHPVQVGDPENDKYTLIFGVPRDYNPSGFEYNYFEQLDRLSKTKGIKVLYPSGDGTFNSVLNYLSAKYNGGPFCDGTLVPLNTNYLPITVNEVRFDDDPNKKAIRITLVFEVAG